MSLQVQLLVKFASINDYKRFIAVIFVMWERIAFDFSLRLALFVIIIERLCTSTYVLHVVATDHMSVQKSHLSYGQERHGRCSVVVHYCKFQFFAWRRSKQLSVYGNINMKDLCKINISYYCWGVCYSPSLLLFRVR
jgi:hypothetical protein